MRYATYILRIEVEELHTDEDLSYVQEHLPELISQAEDLIATWLPEGWDAKIDDAEPQP